jgi:DNA-binding transcriptional regulator YdaS (Cro superfamily)
MSKEALEKAVLIVGTASALAEMIGISKGAISQWKDEGRRIPAEHCPAIERATNGEVRCEDLRPDVDWAYLRAAAQPSESPALPYTIPNGAKAREAKDRMGRQLPKVPE